MALQVKKKNIGQKPTHSNPYLNKTNLPYQKGIIMEEGGLLYDYQNGGKTPIIVNNSKDPRLLAYRDSLNLHNLSKDVMKSFEAERVNTYNQRNISQNQKEYSNNLLPLLEDFLKKSNKLSKYEEKTYNKIKPSVKSEIKDYDSFTGKMSTTTWNTYKKPVQPVIYKKPEPVKPITSVQTVEQVVQPQRVIEPTLREYSGNPIYANTPYSRGTGALIGFENKGDTTYIAPEDYERFAVPTYGKKIIESKKKMEEGGELQPGQLSQFDIEKKLALEKKLAYEKGLPENQGKKYSWYERNIKNPLDGMGVNTGAIEFGLEGAGIIQSGLALGSLAKNSIKRLLSKKSKGILPKEKIITKITNGDKEIFVDELGNEVGSIQRFSEIDKMRNINWGTPKQSPSPKTIPNPDYTDKGNAWLNIGNDKKPGFDKMKPGVQKAIGGMFNPFKEKIVPQETSTESDDYEDDMDDMDMDYQSQLSERDVEMDKIMKEKQALERKSRMDNKMIEELSLAKYDLQQEELAQSLVRMEDEKGINDENIYSSQSSIGKYGHQIMSELSSSLGYKPIANSIFRTPEKQEQLIKQGFGVKNSFHLTGDAVDLKPEDWKKVPDIAKAKMKGKYDIISHNNHIHIEPKTRFKVGGVYEGIDYKGLEELKKLGYKFEIL